jgi:hypothetical protein
MIVSRVSRPARKKLRMYGVFMLMYVEYRENSHPFAMGQRISITNATEQPLLAVLRLWFCEIERSLWGKQRLGILK